MAAGVISVALRFSASGDLSSKTAVSEPSYAWAFASFAPINTDLFVADGDGTNPKPLLPHPALDYSASFSPEGTWIVFTSEREMAY